MQANSCMASAQYDHDVENRGVTISLDEESCNSESESKQLSTRKLFSSSQSVPRRGCNVTQSMVYAVLVVAAIGFGFTIYFLLSNQEHQEFQSSFESYAREVTELVNNNAVNTFGQFRTLATAITSHSLSTQEQFPNVILPYFDKRVSEVVELTAAEMLLWVPLVEKADRSKFELDWLRRQAAVELDYNTRGWNTSGMKAVATPIHECTWCAHVNNTQRGYVNDGFMEEIMINNGYTAGKLSAPVSQFGPRLIDTGLVGLDLYSHPTFKKEMVSSVEYGVPVISEKEGDLEFLYNYIDLNDTSSKFRSFTLDEVYEDFGENARVVGFVVSVVPWNSFFRDLLPNEVNGLVMEMHSDCGSNFTYITNGGKDDIWLDGSGHSSTYNEMAVESKFFWKEHASGQSRHCHFNLTVYPSDEFRSQYETNEPVFYASLVIIVFLFTAIVFFIFARFMEHRQSKLEDKAARAVAVVNSVFPEQIGQRLIAGGEQQRTGKVQLDSYFGSRNTKELSGIAKPMADLFMDTTVLFADIAGFTAWASTREPSQVFMLLESLYYQFDKIAQKRGIFKVETIGDSYVAAAGLPTPRTDHYIAMAKFAGDIMDTMDMMTQQLEVDLGPDTSSLGLRIGLNSGAVTAGVLRGDRARFQLFGDTVNTAARMESTGACGRIQISQSTADLLAESGKSSWFIARQDKVDAKGKGLLQTYWLLHRHSITDNDLHGCSTNSTADSADSHSSQNLGLFMDPKKARLVNWNVEILSSLLLKLTNQRRAAKVDNSPATVMKELESNVTSYRNVLDEVVEVMDLKCPEKQISLEVPLMEPLPELDPKVYSQLKLYVASIASMYHDNPFHSFEHASHVTMSVIKLMNRIIAHPNDYVNQNRHHGKSDFNECIFGDVLTQFSVAFSALLHDVDHSGVTNATLVQEQTEAAILYGNKSVAEQNSIDVAWHLLMENDFVDLRQAIYVNKSEFLRFRQLVVNTILATDIMDKDLKQLREERWLNAFHTADASMCKDVCNRKATIIIEHLIQASDVAHTMQHFHIYKKWNEQLFMEMHKAYKDGKTDNDPSDGWYKGELGFFDFYIIPLAKKLDICGVFGVSSHEYLSYAKQNRMEWESKGLQIVEEYKAKAAKEFG